jgi:hypothetical protein
MAVLWFAREGIESTTGFAAYNLPLKIVVSNLEANVIFSSTRVGRILRMW